MNTSAPNIVIIHADQYRHDCFSLRGHPVLQTPNLDYLAHSGADFTRAYSECPICIPARHTVLTGMDPQATGVMGFETRARIARPEATLSELFKQAGYQTAHVGRDWHQYPAHAHYGFEMYEADPFDEYYSRFQSLNIPGSNHRDRPNWPHFAQHAVGPNSICARPWPYSEEFHQTNFAVNKGIEFLNRRDLERPFLLSLGTVAPHPPLVPPAYYLEKYLRRDVGEPVIGSWAEPPGTPVSPQAGRQRLEGHQLRETKAGYYGLINHLDDQLALFLTKLHSKVENVYVFFISDHGEMLGDHYFYRKSLPYEGSAHIPFFLSGPGIPEGTQVSRPVGLQDVLPTCCDIAGFNVPEHVTGRSLLPLARGEEDTLRDWLHGEHAQMKGVFPGMHYLTDGHEKYIWFADGLEQLFDLDSDPHELENLSGSTNHQTTMERWRGRLIERLKDRPEGFSDGTRLILNQPFHKSNSRAKVDP